MRGEHHMICDICQGTVYPRQCRNSAAFRQRQAAPEICPHGIPLNNLPIGDNTPPGGGVSAVVAVRGVECIHAQPYRTCGGCVTCTLDDPILRVVKRSECGACPVRKEEHEAVHVH